MSCIYCNRNRDGPLTFCPLHNDATSVAARKLNLMKRGKTVVTSDLELDQMLELNDDAVYEVRSVPNPEGAGYRAWIDHD